MVFVRLIEFESIKMLQSAAKRLRVSAFLIAVATTSFAETTAEKFQLNFYGNFIHTEKVPNTLFFFDEIEKNDSFELRKAMRNHDIDTIVLSSSGGSVFEGLQMAGIIHDNKLKTYVPKQGLVGEGNCASACAFMFFGGVNREAGGKLGVHQFYSQNSNDSAEIGKVEGGTQYTAGEIIGFLNDFDTPPFVFEKMFQQSDMYYFNNAELELLEANEGTLLRSKTIEINAFIQSFVSEIEKLASEAVADTPPKVKAPKTKSPSPQPDIAVIKAVQTELKRLGCMNGIAHGVIDNNSKVGLDKFNRVGGTAFKARVFFTSKRVVTLLKEAPSGFCSTSAFKAPKTKSPSLQKTSTQIIRSVQYQLYRIGCGKSDVEGVVTQASKIAVSNFNNAARTNYDPIRFFQSEKTIEMLTKKPAQFCSSRLINTNKTPQIIRSIQYQLERIGCGKSDVKGLVNQQSKTAVYNFNYAAQTSFHPIRFFQSEKNLEMLTKKPAQFCSSRSDNTKRKKPGLQSDVVVIKAIQAQLNRIGCKLGKVDGLVGPASKRALNNFNRINNSSYAAKTFFTAPTMVAFLKGKPSGFCPVTTKNKTKSATKTVTQKNIRVRPRYELLVNCGNKNKKHWLHFWDPNATGWNRATVPSNVKYTFELENNGRGEYGLCGGLTCHWRFSGWALNQRNDTLTFRVNDYATEYSSKPAGFNGTYTFSKDGRTISGTDSNGCSVRGTAK